jgi:hypothetical protein
MQPNLFHGVNERIRTLLADTECEVLQMIFSSATATGRFLDHIRTIAIYLQRKSLQVLPLIESFEPSVAEVFEIDYQYALRVSELFLQNDARSWHVTEENSGNEDRCALFYEMKQTMTGLMEREEKYLQPILQRYYNDTLLKDLKMQLARDVPPVIHAFALPMTEINHQYTNKRYAL